MARDTIKATALLPGLRMSRRTLLAAGGATAVGGGAVYLGSREGTFRDRRSVVVAATPASPVAGRVLGTPPAPATPPVRKVDPADVIEEVSVADLRGYLDSGAFAIAELVDACLDRIKELDRGETGLHAVIELNPDAAKIAEELDQELLAGTSRGPCMESR